MTLRTKLTFAVAALVAAAVALSGLMSVVTARGELTGEVDDFLRRRVDNLLVIDDLFDARRGRPIRPTAVFFDQADAITQVLDSRAEVRVEGQVPLPVDDEDAAIAARAGVTTPRIRTVTVDDVDYRVITASIRGGGAVQVARDLTEVQDAMGGLTRRTILLVVAGTGVAAIVAWLLASRLSRPVVALTRAAEHVAETQDLSATLDVAGRDEVARLSGSFNTMLEALDTSRQQQRRLVMDASHELRTPLTSLRTNAELLGRAPSMSEQERAEVVDAIRDEVGELTALVTELVDLATESTRPAEPLVSLDLGELASDVVERYRRRSGRDIRLSVAGSGRVEARVSAIDRALSNLVDNALKFSTSAEPVEVEVRDGLVRVRDHGPGIPPEERSRVFDRFYRTTASRALPGSGLGLAIVAEIIGRHDGRVFVEDPAEGGGIVVGFELVSLAG